MTLCMHTLNLVRDEWERIPLQEACQYEKLLAQQRPIQAQMAMMEKFVER